MPAGACPCSTTILPPEEKIADFVKLFQASRDPFRPRR
jgi:hypothetical protein